MNNTKRSGSILKNDWALSSFYDRSMVPKFNLLLFAIILLTYGCGGDDTTRTDPEPSEKVQPDAASIDFSQEHQVIRGFGAANIVGWRPDMTDAEIQEAFGTGKGQLGLSILRLRIPPNKDQFGMNVPSAKAASDMGVKVVASPWTPPPTMKTNNDPVGGRLNDDSYADYAAYLNSFQTYMDDNGISLYAISVQNEPDIDASYESCDWTPSEMARFMEENASMIDTRVMAPESFQFRKPISDAILNNSAAAENLDIVGGHIYGGGLEPYPLAGKKGKELWMTEHYTSSDRSGNLWPDALEVGNEIHQVMNANMNAYIWWYIVRYYGFIGDGEEGTTKGEITKRGYVMSQFSRFIRPGYHRIGADEEPKAELHVSAYQGEGKAVIVAVNMGQYDREQQFILQNSDHTIFSMTPYVTSESKNAAKGESITVSDEYDTFTYDIPAHNIVTFVEEN